MSFSISFSGHINGDVEGATRIEQQILDIVQDAVNQIWAAQDEEHTLSLSVSGSTQFHGYHSFSPQQAESEVEDEEDLEEDSEDD